MTETAIATLDRLLAQALDAVDGIAGDGGDAELVALLSCCEKTARRLDQAAVAAIAGLERRGVFAAKGYRTAGAAVMDLLGWERREARLRTVAAEQVVPRTGLDGAVLPARLPATSAAFAAGRASLRHVEVVARVLGSPSAGRLTPEQWAGAESAIADKTSTYTPSELENWAAALIETLDQDGAEPDDRPPAQTNELLLTRLPGGGGKLRGRFDDAAMFDAIATVIDAKSRPLTADDHRPAGERQAAALADVCGYVLDHGDVPECGGHRPHVNVLIRLEDLENRARAACLDFGGVVSPESLRMLCYDAVAVPIVLNGRGQPLDVGRATRTTGGTRSGDSARPFRQGASAPTSSPRPGRIAPGGGGTGSRMCASRVRENGVLVADSPHSRVGVRR